MPPIRILIVDDSAVVRRVLGDGLEPDPSLEVVGTAANGRIALSKIPQVNPDLITLDVEMPQMNGLETLVEIRKAYPKLPVIMFSTLTERGAATTLDALAMGASDYVTKPSNTGSLDATLSHIREQLIPRIKALCAKRPGERARLRPSTPAVQSSTVRPAREPSRVDVLAIGASTGGPNALAELLPAIPEDFPVPVIIVQHMPPLFTRLLADRLNSQSSLTIQEGTPGAILKPGEAWIAPGDFHMTVERQGTAVRLAMSQNPPENSCRPAVDPMFRSVAKTFGPNVLGVVLTGMGSDGVIGAQHIRERGGQILVQDEASSVVWGMPGQVSAAGLADGTYPLGQIAGEIVRRVAQQRHGPPGNSYGNLVGLQSK
jgi:two-component system, chemotaxis family, protein-glutamate methylesterase/glutaminase